MDEKISYGPSRRFEIVRVRKLHVNIFLHFAKSRLKFCYSRRVKHDGHTLRARNNNNKNNYCCNKVAKPYSIGFIEFHSFERCMLMLLRLIHKYAIGRVLYYMFYWYTYALHLNARLKVKHR